MNDGPISEGSKNEVPAGCLLTLAAVLATFGLLIFWAAVLSPVRLHLAAQSWRSTACRIKTATIDVSHGENSTSYLAEFTYDYHVDGVNYVGDRDGISRDYGSRSSARDRVEELPVGKQVECWCDPNDPAQSLLDRSLSRKRILLSLLLPVIFAIAGTVTAWFGFRKLRESRNENRIVSPTSQIAVDTQAMFHPSVIDRHATDRKAASTSTGVLIGSSSANAVSHSGDMADQKVADPQRLKPQSSAWGRLLGIVFIAAFWNGVVGVFVRVLIFDPPFGAWGQIGLGLFLLPFVLIGLLIIAGALHAAMAMFNPSVSIALSTGAVARGGDVDVAWEVRGGLRRIGTLHISLIGSEWAQYRQGTDTKTDESTFAVVPVVTTDQTSEISFGSRMVTVPTNVMHTFDQSNNKIKWSVRVRGAIAWWPDVNEQFRFRVKPTLAAGASMMEAAEMKDA